MVQINHNNNNNNLAIVVVISFVQVEFLYKPPFPRGALTGESTNSCFAPKEIRRFAPKEILCSAPKEILRFAPKEIRRFTPSESFAPNEIFEPPRSQYCNDPSKRFQGL